LVHVKIIYNLLGCKCETEAEVSFQPLVWHGKKNGDDDHEKYNCIMMIRVMMHNNSNSYGISDNKNSNSISNSSDIKM
jgi:hypothetical protein